MEMGASGGAQGPVSAPLTPPAKQAEPAESLPALLMKVAGAIGAGVGVVGFVTFFGGAIVWLRAREVGISPDEAVAVVPKSVLVTMGASYLVPASLIALGAVVVLALIHVVLLAPSWGKARAGRRKARELRYAADKAIRDAEPEEKVAVTARAFATRLSETYDAARLQTAATAQLEGLQEQAEQQQKLAMEREEVAMAARGKAEEASLRARNAEAEAEFALVNSPRVAGAERVLEYIATFAVLTAVPLLLDRPDIHELGFLDTSILFAFALGAAIISLTAYLFTERFIWFGLVAFVGIALYTACVTYLRTTKAPKAEPVAVLRSEGHQPILGLFIADTEANVYVGTFAQQADPAHLRVIPRSEATDVAIGPLLGLAEARRDALELAIHECREIVEAQTRTSSRPATACSKREKTYLKSSLSGPSKPASSSAGAH
jgi:hypothetical protein